MPRPAAAVPAPEPEPADAVVDDDQELVLEEFTREQVLDWRHRGSAARRGLLTLDTAAVRTLAVAAARTLGPSSCRAGSLPDAAAVREAWEQVRAGWAAAGVR